MSIGIRLLLCSVGLVMIRGNRVTLRLVTVVLWTVKMPPVPSCGVSAIWCGLALCSSA